MTTENHEKDAMKSIAEIDNIANQLQKSINDNREYVLLHFSEWNGDAADMFKKKYLALCDDLQEKIASFAAADDALYEHINYLQNGEKS